MINVLETNPKTLEQAKSLITSALTIEEINYIHEHDAESVHFGFGMAMRNAWLWNEVHPLHLHMRARFGLGHADDMSGIILRAVDCSVKNKPHDIEAQVAHYKQHWIDAGIDPLTQQHITESPTAPVPRIKWLARIIGLFGFGSKSK